MTWWKSKVGVVSGVISSTESESEESERFYFFRFRLRLRRLWSSENWVVGLGSRSGIEEPSNRKARSQHCHWFILPLLLATPPMQFLLDRKRRSNKQNHCFASDSVGLVFTWSYRSTLLITTATARPSLVKTSLKKTRTFLAEHINFVCECDKHLRIL